MTHAEMEEVAAAAGRFVSFRILHNNNNNNNNSRLYLCNTYRREVRQHFKLQTQAQFRTMMNGKCTAKHTTQKNKSMQVGGVKITQHEEEHEESELCF